MKGELHRTLFQKKLLAWYHRNKRTLPWRESQNPYHIWVSEIILQQTRVAQGLPYYQRFIEAFPNVQALAKAPQQNVLRLWQGLGYYSRARNMHACAQQVVKQYGGQFPSAYPELLHLKGIGPYTAAAIASIAFNQPHAVVDGNVFRVLARVYGIDTNIAGPEGKKLFTAKANELIDEKQPGDFNQAMMELGATCCTPQNPQCTVCPLEKFCHAHTTDSVDLFPVKTKKVKIRQRHFHYFVLGWRNKVALRQRSGNDIWKGLFEFYLVETAQLQAAAQIISADSWLRSLPAQPAVVHPPVKHVLTHQHLQVSFYEWPLAAKVPLPPGMAWHNKTEAEALPKPVVITRFLDERL